MYKMNWALRKRLLEYFSTEWGWLYTIHDEIDSRPSYTISVWYNDTIGSWSWNRRSSTCFMVEYKDCDYTISVLEKTTKEAYKKVNRLIRKMERIDH